MGTTLDPDDIYDRGLNDLSSLQGPERLVYMLTDFDNFLEMEGWEGYFMSEANFGWYAEMKEWLRTIGDEKSLGVLKKYENYLKKHNVALTADAIAEFVEVSEDSIGADLQDSYDALRTDRWKKAKAYLKTQGLEIEI